MKKLNAEATSKNMNEILNFLEKKSQFKFTFTNGIIDLKQIEDNKKIEINSDQVDKVLSRQDLDGSHFLQINFKNNTKILITNSLIGFKPHEMTSFDSSRIPRVVTTVDLVSVFKAIEHLFDSDDAPDSKAEVEILKKVYQSILLGAENIGFKMTEEKKWFSSIMLMSVAISA